MYVVLHTFQSIPETTYRYVLYLDPEQLIKKTI